MFAIVEIAGLQYKVEQNQKLFVNRLKGEKGTKVSFDKVLLTNNGTVTAVSYTHLDVYKRQAFHRVYSYCFLEWATLSSC